MLEKNAIQSSSELGATLRKARVAQALTLQEVREKLDNTVSIKFLSQIERGERKPSEELLRMLAKVLDINEDLLIFLLYVAHAPEGLRHLLLQRTETTEEPSWFQRYRSYEKVLLSKPDEEVQRILDVIDTLLCRSVAGSTNIPNQE